jgi:hypothetical protein
MRWGESGSEPIEEGEECMEMLTTKKSAGLVRPDHAEDRQP